MNKFKAGDVVVCVQAAAHLIVGKKYKITDYFPKGHKRGFISHDAVVIDGLNRPYYKERFELANRTAFVCRTAKNKPGARHESK